MFTVIVLIVTVAILIWEIREKKFVNIQYAILADTGIIISFLREKGIVSEKFREGTFITIGCMYLFLLIYYAYTKIRQ